MKRTGDREDGCATFWKTGSFRLRHQQALHFKEYEMNDNVAAITLLEVLQPTSASAAGGGAEAAGVQAAVRASAVAAGAAAGAAAAVAGAGASQLRPRHKYISSPEREGLEAASFEQGVRGGFGRRSQGMKRYRSGTDENGTAGQPQPPAAAVADRGDGNDSDMDLDDGRLKPSKPASMPAPVTDNEGAARQQRPSAAAAAAAAAVADRVDGSDSDMDLENDRPKASKPASLPAPVTSNEGAAGQRRQPPLAAAAAAAADGRRDGNDSDMDLGDDRPKALRTGLMPARAAAGTGRPSGLQLLLVGNTHILFNPKRGDVKLGQLRTLLTTLEELREQAPAIISSSGGSEDDGSGSYGSGDGRVGRQGAGRLGEDRVGAVAGVVGGNGSSSGVEDFDIPVLVMGDMNLSPYSPMYQYMQQGFLDCLQHHRKDLSGEMMGG